MTGTDDACRDIGGVCQATSIHCAGDKRYYSGLCAPPSHRYCCAQTIGNYRLLHATSHNLDC